MTRFADRPVVEVSITIDASVSEVWNLVTDINLPARFQKEFIEAEWIDEGPALEARFLGRNSRRDFKWETTSWVVEYEPMAAFGWAVSDRYNPGATWTYFLDEDADTTVLRYRRILGPGPSGLTSAIERNPAAEEEIIASRDAEQRANMQAVLSGIKQLAESQQEA
jgi:hypothetical protein